MVLGKLTGVVVSYDLGVGYYFVLPPLRRMSHVNVSSEDLGSIGSMIPGVVTCSELCAGLPVEEVPRYLPTHSHRTYYSK